MMIKDKEWISVDRFLPIDTKTVLIALKSYPRPVVGFYSAGKASWNIGEKGWEYISVSESTHWKSMPEMPK